MSGQQLELSAGERLVDVVEVLDGIAVGEGAAEIPVAATADKSALVQSNLFGEAERIAARAASAGTRRQYAAIYRAFGDWLRGQLGRPPVVEDLDADVIAAYGRYLATSGGREEDRQRRRPRACMCWWSERSPVNWAAITRSPKSRSAPRARPPETLTDTDYANLLRVPDTPVVGGQA